MDELIPLLRRNARASVEDLAKELNTTNQAVESRIAKLEETSCTLARTSGGMA